jgi:hypothetical protein
MQRHLGGADASPRGPGIVPRSMALIVDLAPLRESRDFRLLVVGNS